MAGWLFVDAPLEPGEVLVFRRVCNQRHGRRTIGGEVSVTDRRVLFVPNRLEQLVRARSTILFRDTVEVVARPARYSVPRLLAAVWRPRAMVEIRSGDQALVLQLHDAAALVQLLET